MHSWKLSNTFAVIINVSMEQMYNNSSKTSIAKIRYRFRKGYQQVTLSDKKEVHRELMQALGITDRAYFYQMLNKGIVNISLPRYESINHIFARRGITDVWETEEI